MSNLVKSVTLVRFDVPDGFDADISELTGYKHSQTIFDAKGNIVSETTYNSDEEIENRSENRYDESGNLIEEKLFDEGEVLTEWRTFEYNEIGGLKNHFQHFMDGSFDTMTYLYNQAGNLIEKTLTDEDGYLESRELFDYQNDKLIKESLWEENDKLVKEILYSYHENGKVNEVTQILIEDGRKLKSVNIFNEDGLKVKSLRYNYKDQLIEISKFAYNELGQLISVEDEDQNKKQFMTFAYDNNGNVISQEETDSEGFTLSKIERKYAEDNRILESQVYMDGRGRGPDQQYLLKYEYEYFG